MACLNLRWCVSNALGKKFAKNLILNHVHESSIILTKNFSSAPSKFTDFLLETAFEEADTQKQSTTSESSTAPNANVEFSQHRLTNNIVQLVSVKPGKITFDENGTHATLKATQQKTFDIDEMLVQEQEQEYEQFDDDIDRNGHYEEQHFDIPDFAPSFIFRHVTTPEELLGPVLSKSKQYKNPEYYNYGRFTFFDLERELQDQRNRERKPEFEPDLINLRFKKNK